jgi:hypothetical protein
MLPASLVAAAAAQFDAWRALGIADEEQACRLAHAWGATGPSADGQPVCACDRRDRRP